MDDNIIEKNTIIRLANRLIDRLLSHDDPDFVEEIIAAVVSGFYLFEKEEPTNEI